VPPSEKQIKLAQDLAKDKKLELPKGYDADLKICKAFIEKALKKK
jgi:DNA topoisomerase I